MTDKEVNSLSDYIRGLADGLAIANKQKEYTEKYIKNDDTIIKLSLSVYDTKI